MENEDNFAIEDNDDIYNQRKSIGAITNSYYNDNSQENSKIYLSSKIEKEQIKDISNNSLYNNNIKNNLLESEEIFINQKKEIEKVKEKNRTFMFKNKNNINNLNEFDKNNNIDNNNNDDNNNINNDINKNDLNEANEKIKINANYSNKSKNNDILIFSLRENKYFEISLFDFIDSDEKPRVPEFNDIWKPSSSLFSYYSEKDKDKEIINKFPEYIEFTKLALRSIQEIDYGKKGLELNIKFSLKGDSELWIFTRCSVNKSINESYYFDEKSVNINENDFFNKYSSVIKIIKERNSNKCFVVFGTFYQETNDNNKLYYKSFLKRQLIDNSENPKCEEYYYFGENDICDFEMFVVDYGEELINTKIFLNNKNKFNDISGKFFLPINKKAKFLICGTGKSVQIKDLFVNIFDKENFNFKSFIQFESDNETPKNCECCSIW